MGAMTSQITSLTIVYSSVYSGTDQRKHQNSASLAFVRGLHRWPVNSPHKRPVKRKMFLFNDVIMGWWQYFQWRHIMVLYITRDALPCYDSFVQVCLLKASDINSRPIYFVGKSNFLLLGFVRTRVLMSRSRLNNGATHGGWHFDIHRDFDTRGR